MRASQELIIHIWPFYAVESNQFLFISDLQEFLRGLKLLRTFCYIIRPIFSFENLLLIIKVILNKMVPYLRSMVLSDLGAALLFDFLHRITLAFERLEYQDDPVQKAIIFTAKSCSKGRLNSLIDLINSAKNKLATSNSSLENTKFVQRNRSSRLQEYRLN